jgi:hypothetical protein
MKKMSTLFVVDYHKKGEPGKIHELVRPENNWVYTEEGVRATRKFDGTAVAIIYGTLYKRYDSKHGKVAPEGAIPCCDPDPISGHHPHWVRCERHKDKYFFEAFDMWLFWEDGTYELCGPKVGNNSENLFSHILIPHGEHVIDLPNFEFSTIKDFLSDENNDIEGIVFHGKNGKMCKIRKTDFGIKR